MPLSPQVARHVAKQSRKFLTQDLPRARAVGWAELAAVSGQFLQSIGTSFAAEACHTLADALGDVPPEVLRDWLGSLPPAVNTAYLRARVLAERESWDEFLRLCGEPSQDDLFEFVRFLDAGGETELAVEWMRRALGVGPAYAALSRVEKLTARLASGTKAYSRQCRIAVLGSSTTNLLVRVLKTLCFRDRIQAEFYEGLYGSIDQEILDSASGLHKFRPNIVFIQQNWRDLQLPPVSSGDVVAQTVDRFQQSWQRLGTAFQCHVVQHAFDYPAADAYGELSASLPGGRARVIDLINLRLRETAPPFVSLLDAAAVEREIGHTQWADSFQWHHYRQHPGTEALPALAELQLAHIRAVLGLTRKVLVTDLDNTMWGGVIGEDGLDGIKIGPGSPEGEAHFELQDYLRDLRSRGILLAACSKNERADAELPFQQHKGMALRLDDFAAFTANWQDKVSNIREIARKLSLGLDSFVFLDDSPLERGWVSSQLPEVAVVPLSSSPLRYVSDLDRGRYFFSISLSAEDRQRAEQYRAEAVRDEARKNAGSLEQYLADLKIRVNAQPIAPASLGRATQLINKTNQFNLTTKRCTEAQVREISQSPDYWARLYEVSDRFGDYGIVGVLICRKQNAQQWTIDTWLMSCRALGRQVENFMFDDLVAAARSEGAGKLIGVYRPTPKNRLVEGLYRSLGFDAAGETPEEFRFEFPISVLATQS